MKKEKAVLGNCIKVCVGGRHAWFESNVGKIRKQMSKEMKKELTTEAGAGAGAAG